MDIVSLFNRPEDELLIRMVRAPAGEENAEAVAAILRRQINWSLLLGLARSHGVLPLFHRYLRVQDRLPVPGRLRRQIREHYLSNSQRNLAKAGVLIRILHRLEQEGISAIPYKGPALAVMAYGDLGLREFEDLDLLVRPQDLRRAREILLGDGFRPAYGLTTRQEHRLLRRKGQLSMLLDGHLVELHQELFHPSFGFRMDHGALDGRLEPVSVAGRLVPTYSPEDTLLILAAHGAKHFWCSLGWICDLAELVHARRDLDWSGMIPAAGDAGAKRMVFLGVFLARELLDAPVPSDVISLVARDAAYRSVAAGVSRWLRSARRPTRWEKTWFLLRVRDRMGDGVRDLLSRLFILPKPAAFPLLAKRSRRFDSAQRASGRGLDRIQHSHTSRCQHSSHSSAHN
jgi:hypothetical protein